MGERRKEDGSGHLEILPEDLTGAKEALMKINPTNLSGEVGGFKMISLYDTGSEPGTGTSRDDMIVGKLEDSNGRAKHFKLDYDFRSGKVSNVEFMGQDEAEELMNKTVEYYKPYWEEKK